MKQYKYTINGTQFDVTIDSINGSQAKVEVNGIPFEVTMHGSSLVEEDLPTVSTEGAAAPAAPAAAPAAEPAAAPAATAASIPFSPPVPGTVTLLAFFMIFPLKTAFALMTSPSSNCLADAAARAIAIGSVHPNAGISSSFKICK